MNRTGELLERLECLDVQLTLDGDRLRIDAPRDALDPILMRELESRKPELIEELSTRQETYPLSFAQERLWILDQLDGAGAAYTMMTAQRLRGRLRIQAFEDTFREILRRHEILRSAFRLDGTEPIQVPGPVPRNGMVLLDLTGLPADRRESWLRRWAERRARRRIDLSSGRPFEVVLARLAAEHWLLVIRLHHIVTDGWSNALFMDELSHLYGCFSSGRPSDLQNLRTTYGQLAVRERRALRGANLERYREFWSSYLMGAAPVLDLASDRSRPAVQSYDGSTVSFTVESDVVAGLRQAARQTRTSLFMTLLTAFGAVISRHAGRRDLVVGTPSAHRGSVDAERLIGFFADTLPVRVAWTGNPSFPEAARQVKASLLAAHRHESMPFGKIVEAVRPPRDLSRGPLVQVVFNLQGGPEGRRAWSPRLDGLDVEPVGLERGSVGVDLEVHVWEAEDGSLVVYFEYATQLFHGVAVERLARHYRTALERVHADPGQSIEDIAALPATQFQLLVDELNQTGQDLGSESSLNRAFERQAAATPDRSAIVDGDHCLSYGELNARANQLARHLRLWGVRRETSVAITVERTAAVVIGMLGILKAGGAYLPLDPTQPLSRLQQMLADSGAALLLTHGENPGLQVERSLNLLTDWEQLADLSKADLDLQPNPRQLAYMIYTSGSTGQPKGVMVEHRGVVNLARAGSRLLPTDAEDVWTVCHAFSFDLSVWELFVPLLTGARVVLVPAATVRSADDLACLLRERAVTILSLTPSALGMLRPRLEDGETDLSVRTIVCGGEALPPALAHRLQSIDPTTWNFYGPTEATVWSIVGPVASESGLPTSGLPTSGLPTSGLPTTGAPTSREPATAESDRDATRAVPIGRPLANTQAYVLDDRALPVPHGTLGEIHLSGVGLTRGYHRRPALTAEKYIPDALGGTWGDRLYRTGDLARFSHSGELECHGRRDHQIKLRGYRIELGDIDAHLRLHPQVRDAAAVLRRDETAGPHIVAFLASDRGRDLNLEALRQHLREQLPSHMVPSSYRVLERLPLNSNGKVDRSALERLDTPFATRGAGHGRRPRTDVERQIARLWCEVLAVDAVGVEDNFFDLGGHSMLALNVHESLIAHYPQLKVVDIFRHPTISALASFLDHGPSSAVDPLASVATHSERQKQALANQRRRFENLRRGARREQ
ncbi:MAG: AMP-binding protein [Thermoanaerobaculia bacterium]|nr:AMP-binding protein [Thermoanaerobaculia bacterium]